MVLRPRPDVVEDVTKQELEDVMQSAQPVEFKAKVKHFTNDKLEFTTPGVAPSHSKLVRKALADFAQIPMKDTQQIILAAGLQAKTCYCRGENIWAFLKDGKPLRLRI